jgi:hypothetical protein
MAIKDRDYRSRALRRNLRKQARKGQLTSREKKELLEQEAAFRDARRGRAPIVGGALAALGGALTIPGVQTALGGGMDRLRDFLDRGEATGDENKPDETKKASEEVVVDGPNAADAYADRLKLEKARREKELTEGAEDALALAGGIQDIEEKEEQFDEMIPMRARQARLANELGERGLQGAGRSIDELVTKSAMDEIRPIGSDERPFDLLSALAGRDLDRALASLPESAGPGMTAPEEILSGSGLEELGVRPTLTSPNNPLSRGVEIRDPRFPGQELGLQDIPVGEENFPGDTRDFNAAMDLLPSLERRGRMMPAGAPVATGGPRATQSDEYRVPMFRELPEFPLDMLIRMQQNPPNRADQSAVPLRVGGPRVENAMGGKTPSVNKLRDMIKKKYGIR